MVSLSWGAVPQKTGLLLFAQVAYHHECCDAIILVEQVPITTDVCSLNSTYIPAVLCEILAACHSGTAACSRILTYPASSNARFSRQRSKAHEGKPQSQTKLQLQMKPQSQNGTTTVWQSLQRHAKIICEISCVVFLLTFCLSLKATNAAAATTYTASTAAFTGPAWRVLGGGALATQVLTALPLGPAGILTTVGAAVYAIMQSMAAKAAAAVAAKAAAVASAAAAAQFAALGAIASGIAALCFHEGSK